MANCVLCGSVTTERTQNKRGAVIAALHNDCAQLEDDYYWAQRGNQDPSYVAELAQKVARMTAKKAGTATQWP